MHVCAAGHPDIEKQMGFCDYLRSHPDISKEYGDPKKTLSNEFEYDNVGYMLGKDPFVKHIVEKSLAWRRTGSSS